jgi:hypothetical protein
MLLRLFVSFALSAAILIPYKPSAAAPEAKADAILTSERTPPGLVKRITSQGVLFWPDCQKASNQIPWADIRSIRFGSFQCGQGPPTWPIQGGAAGSCEDGAQLKHAYQLMFAEPTCPIYARQVALDEDKFDAVLSDGRGTLECQAADVQSKVKSIRPLDVCPEDIVKYRKCPLPASMRLTR